PPALPEIVGSPVIVVALLGSLAELVNLRDWAALEFFTMNDLPRTCWSLACAKPPSKPSPATTADSARVLLMGPPFRVDSNTSPRWRGYRPPRWLVKNLSIAQQGIAPRRDRRPQGHSNREARPGRGAPSDS